MRVFLIFDNHGAEVAHIIRELEKNSHEVLYWVGAPNREVQKYPEIIFHNYKDARSGIPAKGLDASRYSPPGADLIRRLYGAESLVMMIMNKMFPFRPFEERKHLYYELLRYWHGVLSEFRPEAIIFPLTPHSNYNYLIYELSKLLGFQTIMFSDTWVSDRTLVHSDLWDAGPKLRKIMHVNSGRQFLAEDLNSDLRIYYERQQGQDREQARPWYYKLYRERYRGLNLFPRRLKILFRNLLSPQLLAMLYGFFASRFGRNTWKEHRKFQIKPDYSRKFVYIPLQYQPERTTTPHGEIFADLILMVETVAAVLPEGWVAYVKEHPTQWWKQGRRYSPFRYPGYYEKIARIPKVFLVPIETDSYELINNCQAVATVTGTPGWEAILRRKPAVIFGYPWYRDCPLAFKAEDAVSCRAAFEKIRNGFRIEERQVLNFLKSFDEATIRCYVDDPLNTLNTRVSELTTEQRLNNLAKSIISELYVSR